VSAHPERDIACIEADGLAIEIDIAPEAEALEATLEQVITSAVQAANDTAGPVQGSIGVLVADDGRIRELNKRWRKIDKPTNVLSFPYPTQPSGPVRHIGDLAISYETAAREAAVENKSLSDHVAHLSVHGFLHLLGYDHETDAKAEAMEQLERAILGRIGVSDPYIASEAEG
jgi:probable rRNA maturation factor